MKPVKSNLSKNGCSPVASDCVTWNGPDLCCITECDGDTLSIEVSNRTYGSWAIHQAYTPAEEARRTIIEQNFQNLLGRAVAIS